VVLVFLFGGPNISASAYPDYHKESTHGFPPQING
jgi:hypothetical protein